MKCIKSKKILCYLLVSLFSSGVVFSNDIEDKIMMDLESRIHVSAHEALKQIKSSLLSKNEKRSYQLLVENITEQEYKVASINENDISKAVANSL